MAKIVPLGSEMDMMRELVGFRVRGEVNWASRRVDQEMKNQREARSVSNGSRSAEGGSSGESGDVVALSRMTRSQGEEGDGKERKGNG